MNFLKGNLFWVRQPKQITLTDEQVVLQTEPNTDLWQRTYYGSECDTAPILLRETDDPSFSFVVKTAFQSKKRFDQCGIAVYLDSKNWVKASIEFENDTFQRLGSVVTNHGYSDWATTDISSSIREMWYRLSRKDSDFCLEYSADGSVFQQMRICHLFEGAGKIAFGIYACSPEDSSFQASFSHLEILPCQW